MIARLSALSIRWRLALITAGLTFAILLLFAVVVGTFTSRQIRADFDDDLRIAAADLQERIGVYMTPVGPRPYQRGSNLVEGASTGEAAIRLVREDGTVIVQTADAPNLGRPLDDVRDVGDHRVVSRPLFADDIDEPAAWIQYAKPRDRVTKSLNKLRLFLFLGVAGGTALALFGGLWLGRRAMAPVARLTTAAQGIARTRDPGVNLPQPEAEDEVRDLARTLEEMLRALDQARGETEAALERQREFVADASHELRTPLTSVLANLEILEQELDGDQREMAGSALRSSRRMRRLVADLLLLARADAGRPPDTRRPLDLAAIAREAVSETEPLTADHDVALAAEPGTIVDGTRDELHRLALNLIENGLAHTPPGTRVSVTVRRDGAGAVLEVADDGPGIAPDLRERVFERFFRAGGDTGAAGGSGSGLGLSIVRAVAEAHNGSVELAPSEDGSRFVVRLPLSAVREPAPAA